MAFCEIINVNAVSLDGAIGSSSLEGDQDRMSYLFTNTDDHEFVRQTLLTADAIITGANSLRTDGRAWQIRNDLGKFVHWIVLTRHGLDSALPFWEQKSVPKTIVSPHEIQDKKTGPEIFFETYGTKHPAEVITSLCRARGYRRVLLFGGGAINKLFFEKKLVDQIFLTLCPLIVGSSTRAMYVDPGIDVINQFELVSSIAIKNHVFLKYKLQR